MDIDTLDLIDQYLRGNLSDTEKEAFEKRIATEEDLQEEVLIHQQLLAIHEQEKISLANSSYQQELVQMNETLHEEDNAKLSQKIRAIGKNQQQLTAVRLKRKKTVKWFYSAAASIVVLISLFFIFNTPKALPDYYQNYVNWEELPSFTVKGDPEELFEKGEVFFKNKEYKNAVATLAIIEPEDKWYPFALLYLGASYDQLNENEAAIETFQKLASLTTSEESSKGYWYQLLLYLKTNQKEKALEMKTKILENPNHYKYKEATELDF